MRNFTPENWYWFVNGDTTRVYSSARDAFVPVADDAFQEWLQSSGAAPTSIASEEELGEVLADYDLRPKRARMLDAYKDKHARQLTLAVVAKILFWLVNEVQTIKGQPTMTPAQFRAKVKDLM